MSNRMTTEEMILIREVHNKVMDMVGDCGLDAYGIIAVLTKCLVAYAIHVEDRNEFYIRMAMTYDFEKSQQPDSKEMH